MFAAIFMRQPGRDPRDIIAPDALETALSLGGFGDVRGHWSNRRMLMAQSLLWNTPESKYENVPEICPETGRVIVGWVRLDNREELCAALGLDLRPTLTDPQIILAAHRKWGEDCSARLHGDFSFVIFDPEHHQIYASRDVAGAKPLFFLETTECLLVCTTLSLLRDELSELSKPNLNWVAQYATGLTSDPDTHAFVGVRSIQGGTFCSWSDKSSCRTTRFRTFERPFDPYGTTADEASKQLRSALEVASEARLRSAYPIAFESSGGLDSSGILGALQGLGRLPKDTIALSMFHMEDEPELLLRMAGQLGLKDNLVSARPTLLGTGSKMERAEQALGHPIEHTHPTYFGELLEAASNKGARTLISGFGGDEIVSNKASKIQIWLRANGRYRDFWAAQKGNAISKSFRALKRTVNLDQTEQWAGWINHLVSSSLLNDDAGGLVRQDSNPPNEAELWARDPNLALTSAPLFSEWRFARLEACSIVGFSLGLDFRWPLLDPKIIEVYLKSSPIARYKDGTTRHLYRTAITDQVPEEIAWRNRKGLGGSFYSNADIDYDVPIHWNALHPTLKGILSEAKICSANRIVKQLDLDAQLSPEIWEMQRCMWRIGRLSNWLYTLS